MPFALTLRLDAAAEARVESLQARLDAAGIGHPSLRLGHPPHITLAVAAQEPRRIALTPPPRLRLRLAHPGLFAAPERVLFLSPLATPELMVLQARAAEMLGAFGLHPHFARGAWVPHVTLARDVPSFDAALDALSPLELPLEAEVAALELVAFPPARILARRAAE
ncbi:2'-5' RNA ligase family protein [Roseococcus sp. YIM B11640]|uniref:2'-5' RNA ligase family protein n=1 Tax=Roseococcus sp. YIM B11640 TaxID=3133973 RepID=UPI003C7D8938